MDNYWKSFERIHFIEPFIFNISVVIITHYVKQLVDNIYTIYPVSVTILLKTRFSLWRVYLYGNILLKMHYNETDRYFHSTHSSTHIHTRISCRSYNEPCLMRPVASVVTVIVDAHDSCFVSIFRIFSIRFDTRRWATQWLIVVHKMLWLIMCPCVIAPLANSMFRCRIPRLRFSFVFSTFVW